MTELESDKGHIVVGSVKWFDPLKGFGFIISDQGGPDILLHANILRIFGQSSVAEDARIKVLVQATQKGVHVIEVLKIGSTMAAEALAAYEGRSGEVTEVVDTSLPLEPARVKWFDEAAGYGFANIFGRKEDIFLHINVLRRFGLNGLQAGEGISLRTVDGERGLKAVQIALWEEALRKDEDD